MYSLHLIILLSIPHLPFLTAEYRLRAGVPVLTAAPLFKRQEQFDCPAEATSCHDGSPGCCNYGEICTFTKNHTPICQGLCNGGPICSGDTDGLCCNVGYTCNYQFTLCETTNTGFYNMPLTALPPPVASATPAAPSDTPSPQATPPSTLPTSQNAPPPAATPGSSPASQPPALATMLPAPQSSDKVLSSLIELESSLAAAATSIENSPYSYDKQSESSSVELASSSIPTMTDPHPSALGSSNTKPTVVESTTATPTVVSSSGASSLAVSAGGFTALCVILLNFGLGMALVI